MAVLKWLVGRHAVSALQIGRMKSTLWTSWVCTLWTSRVSLWALVPQLHSTFFVSTGGPRTPHTLPFADLFEGHVVFTPLNGSANCNDFWASCCSVVGHSEPSNFVDSNGSILTPNGSISTSMAQFQLQWLNLNGSCSPHAYRIPKVSFYVFKAHSVALFWICGHRKPNLAVSQH